MNNIGDSHDNKGNGKIIESELYIGKFRAVEKKMHGNKEKPEGNQRKIDPPVSAGEVSDHRKMNGIDSVIQYQHCTKRHIPVDKTEQNRKRNEQYGIRKE